MVPSRVWSQKGASEVSQVGVGYGAVQVGWWLGQVQFGKLGCGNRGCGSGVGVNAGDSATSPAFSTTLPTSSPPASTYPSNHALNSEIDIWDSLVSKLRPHLGKASTESLAPSGHATGTQTFSSAISMRFRFSAEVDFGSGKASPSPTSNCDTGMGRALLPRRVWELALSPSPAK